jgi:hypothetical protein
MINSPAPTRLLPFVLMLSTLGIGLQILKGLSLETGLYPLLTSLFTYVDGPIRRGLLPSLMHLAGVNGLDEMAAALSLRHFVLLGVLTLCLLGIMVRHWQAEGATGPRLLLYVLFLASPVLPLLAALNGYADILVVLGLLALHKLLNSKRDLAAAGLLLLLVLVHEMVLPLALPLWLFAIGFADSSARRWRLIKILAATLLLITGYLMVTAQTQSSLAELAQTRCESERPSAHPQVEEIWDVYCHRQMTATLASDFVPARLIVLPFFWLSYGLFPFLLLLLWYGQTRRGGWRSGLVTLPLLFMPYALVTIAWDTDRFIMLSCVTGWLLLDGWLEKQPAPVLPAPGRVLVLGLTLFQIALNYPALDVYGQYRLLPPSLAQCVLIDPRLWTLPLLQELGLMIPPFLDPAT